MYVARVFEGYCVQSRIVIQKRNFIVSIAKFQLLSDSTLITFETFNKTVAHLI